MDSETLVHDYLGTLDVAAADLPADRRIELVSDVRGHIELALASAGTTDEATVRAVLARLGSVEEIVAAESDPTRSLAVSPRAGTPLPGQAEPRRLSTEARALLLFTVGALVLPYIGPVAGLWVASGSHRWTMAQKRAAALMVIVLLTVPAMLLLPAIVAGELTWVVTSGGFLIPLVSLAGFAPAIYLVASSTLTVTVARRP
jgi:HAAS